MKYVLVFMVLFSSQFSYGDEKINGDVVGCWESEISEYDNKFTICINYDAGAISTYFSNKGEEGEVSKPTVCSQPALVDYEDDGTIKVEGLGGYCKNGRKQVELTFRCLIKPGDNNPCEMYSSYDQLKFKELNRIQ